MAESNARQIARFQSLLPLCPSLKPGSEANRLWPRLWSTYTFVQPDKPAVRAWIADKTAQFRGEHGRIPRTPARWCDVLKIEFGGSGMVVNNDGSKPEHDCRKTDTCGDPRYLYSY